MSLQTAEAFMGIFGFKRAPYEKPDHIPDHPWQLTEGEWNYLREQVRPNVAQSRPSALCKSIAVRRAQELDWLLYGIVLTDRPVTWRDVIEKHKIETTE
jgi:hypothetical protein